MINHSANERIIKYELFKKWKCGTINVRSGKEKDEGAKIYSIAKQISKMDLSFCCIQEIKYRNSGKKLIELDNGRKYHFLWCGTKKRRQDGVGILLLDDKEIKFDDPDVEDPRLMAFNLNIFGFKIRLLNVYAPSEPRSENLKNNFYRMLRKATVKNQKDQKLLVLGDFNAKTSVACRKCDFDGIKVVVDDNCNDNGYRLKNYCRNYKLGIGSSFFDYQMENRWTWYSCDKITKRVNDYMLAERYIQQFVTNCIAEPDIDFDSDHRILVTELNSPKTKKARWKEPRILPGKPRPDAKFLFDDGYRNRYVNTVQQYLQNNPMQINSTNEEKSTRIVNTLQNAAKNTIPLKTKNRRDNNPWKNDILFNNIIDSRQNTDKTSNEYKELTKKLKKRIKFLKNQRLKQEASNINTFATNKEIEQLYKRFTSDTSPFLNNNPSKKCDPVKLKDHFQKHFDRDYEKDTPPELIVAPRFIEILKENNEHVNCEPPSIEEITSVMKKLKGGKAASDIPAEFIKAATTSDAFMQEMKTLYIDIWNTVSIPSSWSKSKLVALWKGATKGKIEDPTAYRGLQIGSSLCKILIIIIINRFRGWYEGQLSDQQQGFRSGRGTTDGIFITKRIQQISHKTRKTLYVLFVDLTAAFDKIERSWLFKSIRQRIPGSQKIVDLLEELYSYTTTALSDTPDDVFRLILGVRQGGPESPLLYNLYMDYVMRVFMEQCASKGIGYPKFYFKIPASASRGERTRVGFNQIDWIGYADDLVLVFEDKATLQKALDELNLTFERFSLKINSTKTKTMIFNHTDTANYPDTIAKIGEETIGNVKEFRYLGSSIRFDQNSTGDAEVDLRIDCAESKFYQHARKFFNRDIAIKTRAQIFNALVRSRLVYGCQTWSLTVNQLQRIKSCYTTMLRKMLRNGYRRVEGTFRYVLTNEQIFKICGTSCVGGFIANQQKKYLAHVVRMDDSATAKRLAFNANRSTVPGRIVTLFSSVLMNEGCTTEEFCRNAALRMF